MKPIFGRLLAFKEGLRHYFLPALFTLVAYLGIVAEIFGPHPSERVWTFKLIMAAAIGFGLSFYFASLMLSNEEQQRFKWPLYLGSIAAAIGSYFLLDNKSEFHIAWCVGIVVIFLVLGVYNYFNETNKRLFFTQFITAIVTAFFMALIFTLGLNVIVAAIHFLLFKLTKYGEITGSLVAFGGVVFFPIALLALLPEKGSLKPSAKAVKILVYNVAFPTVVALIAVLYVYIAKILITWDLPSGQINWFVSYAALAFIIFSLILPQYESRIIEVFKRVAGGVMIPLIVVQLIMVYIRLDAYGLTPLRWASLICIAIAICFVVASFFKRMEYIHKAVLAIVVGAFVLALGPFSIFEVPAWEQNLRLTGILEDAQMLEPATDKTSVVIANPELEKETKNKIFSAYIELDRYRARGGKTHLPEWLPERTAFKDNFGFELNESYAWEDQQNENPTYYTYFNWTEIDLSGAQKLYFVRGGEQRSPEVVMGEYGRFSVAGKDFDIREELAKLPQEKGGIDPSYEPLYTIQLDENYVLYIESATVYGNPEANSYNDLSGFIVVKEH